jgi:hypothetical protein
MKQVKTFWIAFWDGLAAPGLLFSSSPNIPRLSELKLREPITDLEAMRDDWRKIGKDFSNVIARETSRLQ